MDNRRRHELRFLTTPLGRLIRDIRRRPFKDAFQKALAPASQIQIGVVKSVEKVTRTRNLGINPGPLAFINIDMSLLYRVKRNPLSRADCWGSARSIMMRSQFGETA
ncbi:hypothetical protein [Bradyrhizobium valentinum]|uniref:hypothetical protein n=1 Tax=Bradyrhizobium valentinum TaxID=1518501 RepID=UPI0012E346C0|nr:hypothetical protein [Bradyrhizobium valentinum]